MGKSKEIYGDPVPELSKIVWIKNSVSITKHGFSVVVYDRTKVGSGFSGSLDIRWWFLWFWSVLRFATMSGISEVKSTGTPLYVCPKCKYSEFYYRRELWSSGFDLPEKNSPPLGYTLLNRDGHTIPFETFLGFDGDKTPDIDLELSSNVNIRVTHRYTEHYSAKTTRLKRYHWQPTGDKTAIGYAENTVRKKAIPCIAEELRLALGRTSVSSVLQVSTWRYGCCTERVWKFTDFVLVQRPANDQKSDNITTHFDFISIHDTIGKLDELGHDDLPLPYTAIWKTIPVYR